MRNKHHITEERNEGKLSRSVLETSGAGDSLAEFNITLSTGEKIAKPDFIKEGQQKVKVASKKLRRKRSPNRNKKIKASRRWKRERSKVSKLQRKVTRQREDWLHKTTSNIVCDSFSRNEQKCSGKTGLEQKYLNHDNFIGKIVS